MKWCVETETPSASLRPESCKKKSSCPLRGPRPDRNEISQALLASSSPKEGSSSSRTYLLCRHLIRALTMWRDGRDDSDPHAPSPCVFRGDGSDSQPLLPHNWQATPPVVRMNHQLCTRWRSENEEKVFYSVGARQPR